MVNKDVYYIPTQLFAFFTLQYDKLLFTTNDSSNETIQIQQEKKEIV